VVLVVIIIIIIMALLLLIAGATRRGARQARRIPCGVCGEPLLPAARTCPNCRGRVPLRGAAGMRERMWRS
jgi:hypothetical protein